MFPHTSHECRRVWKLSVVVGVAFIGTGVAGSSVVVVLVWMSSTVLVVVRVSGILGWECAVSA